MFLDLIRDSLFMNTEMTHFPLYLSSFHSWGVGVGAHSSSGGPFQALCVGSRGKSGVASRICIHSAPAERRHRRMDIEVRAVKRC